MKSTKNTAIAIALAIAMTTTTGCSDLIEFSPFDADINSYNANTNNIAELNQSVTQGDTLKFAVFSDSHSYYDELSAAVKSINHQEGIQFVICCGDITESGLANEFNYYYNLTSSLKFPLITAIGNHDYLSNGAIIFGKMFGETNFSFINGNYKFVVFDDIVWENDNSEPDFDWLQTELSADTSKTNIIISHIPPWTDQLEGEASQKYENIISNNKVMLCLHGHLHNFEVNEFASVPAIVTGSVEKRTYNIISICNNQYSLKQISF